MIDAVKGIEFLKFTVTVVLQWSGVAAGERG